MSALPALVDASARPELTAPATWAAALLEAAARDERVMVLTAENRAPIRGVSEALGSRFVDFGICEQTLVGASAGLALRGRRPVVHALASFLTMRAFEFIRTDVGIPRLPVVFVGFVPGFLSEANGPTHQALEDIALMRGIPGMQVVCPADETELVAALPVIFASGAPTYVRYNHTRALVEHEAFVLGRAECTGEPGGVALLTYGFLHGEAVRAAAILRSRGVPVRLVNLRSLKPVDQGVILEAARTSELLVTLEDHFETGGLFSITAETLLARGRTARVLPLALRERFFKPAPLQALLAYEGFTGTRIAERILEALCA